MTERRPRVLLVGDIGGASTFHVGDEAMFAADLALVQRLLPSAHCIAVSAEPAFTASTLGIDAVERPSAGALQGSSLDGGPPALAAAAEADLLVVTGGGNLNASFPELIMERLALARATADGGGAVVVLGQTLGPALTPANAVHVAELLGRAGFVGLRDQASMAVAIALGIEGAKIVEQLDDAWAMEASTPSTAPFASDRTLIAVTLHPDPRIVPPPAISALADQLAELAGATGSALVLIPHCRAAEGLAGSSDETVAADLAAQLGARGVDVTVLPVLPPKEVVGATSAADIVISSRYHPLVFAQRAAVPALALWADPYVRAKQVGALEHAGLHAWALPVDEALRGGLVPAALETFDRRGEIRAWLSATRPGLEVRMAAGYERLVEFLRDAGFAPTRSQPAAAATMPELDVAPRPVGGWDTAAPPAPRPVPDPLLAEFFALREDARGLEVECGIGRAVASGARAGGGSMSSSTTVLDRLRLEVDADVVALAGRISGPHLDRADVRFRVHAPDLASRIDASATPMLPIVTMIAAALGTDLVIEAPVDECALDNAERAAAVLEDWWGWRRPRIAAATTIAARAPAAGAGLWFSRGVDSTSTLVAALAGDLVLDGDPVSLTHLLGLDWIDPPFAVMSTREVWRDTQSVASSLGLSLLRFTSDARAVLDPILPWERSHGALFAGLGLLVGPTLGTVCLSASSLVGPYGSHPGLDPLWSSSGTAIAHAGAGEERSRKVARIAEHPWAVDRLKVCWTADTARNCGRCSKCLVTMTMFHALGALARVDRFDSPLSPHSVRALATSPGPLPTVPETVDDILRILAPEDGELRAAWEDVRERLQQDLGARAEYI